MLDGVGVPFTNAAPFEPAEVCRTKPGLVNVEQGLPIEVYLEQCLRELLSQYLVLLAVTLPRNLIDALVPEIKFISHDFTEHPLLNLDALRFLQMVLEPADRADV